MAEHKDLPEAQLHNTKGIASANAGDVQYADGAGGGSWSPAAPIVQNTPHGEASIASTAGIVIAIGDTGNDIRDDASYKAIAQLYTEQAALINLFTVDPVTGEFIAEVDGIYTGSIWITFAESIGNQILGFKASKNGVYNAAVSPVFHDKTKAVGDRVNISGGSLFSAVAGDKIGMGVAAEATGNLTIFDSAMSISMVRAL